MKRLLCKLFGWFCPKPPPQPPDDPPPLPPPRVDRPVDFGAIRGVTSFALYMQEREFIEDYVHYCHERGYNWFRCGAQTDGWRDFGVPYLHAGPAPPTPEWREALETLLDVTARIPDTWVQLIPTFTHKQDDMGSQKENVKYFKQLCDRSVNVVLEGGYKHVFWEAFNEAEHPLSQHIKDEDVREIIIYLKDRTGVPVGTDHSGRMRDGRWDARYPYIWRDVVDYIAFHPPRNPNPPQEEWAMAVERYAPRFVLFDETTCWASQVEINKYNLRGSGNIVNRGEGGDILRQNLMVDEKRKAKSCGRKGRYLFHSTWGIESNSLGWLPKY